MSVVQNPGLNLNEIGFKTTVQNSANVRNTNHRTKPNTIHKSQTTKIKIFNIGEHEISYYTFKVS